MWDPRSRTFVRLFPMQALSMISLRRDCEILSCPYHEPAPTRRTIVRTKSNAQSRTTHTEHHPYSVTPTFGHPIRQSRLMPDMRFLRHRERIRSSDDLGMETGFYQTSHLAPAPPAPGPVAGSTGTNDIGMKDPRIPLVEKFFVHSPMEAEPPLRPTSPPSPTPTSSSASHLLPTSQTPSIQLSSSNPTNINTRRHTPSLDLDSRLGFWERSRLRARNDKTSWDYVLRSGAAGGLAGCVAKTAIAPLDRVKILFQTSNADFKRYAGTPLGVLHAIRAIIQTSGPIGLFQGHSATLLRIFPYAGIKFMAYERLDGLIMPTKEMRTPGRLFLAGSLAGITSVLFTYPLELIRVRLAFQTKKSEQSSLREVIRQLYIEGHPLNSSAAATAAVAAPPSNSLRPSHLVARIPVINAFIPFYRGFSITIVGMIPYAGVSFLTYGTLKRHAPTWSPYMANHKTFSDLTCGAIAGAVSQTASYPFEVIRRRMQVGGMKGFRSGMTWQEAVKTVYKEGRMRGFFVGLSIGYVKVIPMTSISFAVWQMAKRAMDI